MPAFASMMASAEGLSADRREHIHQIFRKNHVLALRQFRVRPPAMFGHDLPLERRPALAGDCVAAGSDNEETLVGHHMLAVRQLQGEHSLADLRADVVDAKARLFPEFADGRLLKRFAVLEPAAGRGPITRACKRTIAVDETKKQKTVR